MNDSPDKTRIICIAGPTASGKSAWAVQLAKTYDGEIINADSMQVYADLQILSARPTPKEMEGIPHHLFGHIDGSVRYSVGTWLRSVLPVIEDCQRRGKTPIVVGGTGLYFKALTVGLAKVPDPSAAGFKAAEALLGQGIDVLRQEAERVDPAATDRVLGDDPQRLLRIVAVALGTLKPLSQWQADTNPAVPREAWQGAVLLPERTPLYERINQRFDAMMDNGGIEEVRRVAERGLAADLPMMKAIGLPPLLDYIRGETPFDAALEISKRDTRRFAKRQFTWFRGQSKGWMTTAKPDDLIFKA